MHLAQLNIARLVDDPDTEVVAEFVQALPAINMLGEGSPGFVWMLKDETGGAMGFRMPGHEHDPRMLINLTVWEDDKSFKHFVTRSGHGMYLRRRLEWFEKSDQPKTVLWWIPEGHEPDLAEASERLEMLRSQGPTPAAFNMRETFPAPDGT